MEVPYLKEMWPDAIFTAFEPLLSSFRIWKHGVKKGQFPGKIMRSALGDKREVKELHCQGDKSSFYKPSRLRMDRNVQVETLDDLDAGVCNGRFVPPVLLWLDVEGYELQVLAGAQKMLWKCVWCCVEIRDDPVVPGWVDGRVVDAWLKDRGFVASFYCGRIMPTVGNQMYVRNKRTAKYALQHS